MSAKEHLPNLDLYNFVEPAASDSPYVLTSPRSLQACSRFGIKPMHLLPKTFDEFEEEYTGYEDVYIAYKKFEKDRLKRLHLCREERERIIDRSNPTELFDEDGEEGSEENVSNRNTSQGGWNVLNADDDGMETRREKHEKPSILSYLESNKIATPRISSRQVTRSYGEGSTDQTMDQISSIKPAFNILSDSEDSDDGVSGWNRSKTPSSVVRVTPRTTESSRQTPRSSRSPRSSKPNLGSSRQTPRSSRQNLGSSRRTPRSSREVIDSASPPASSRSIPSARESVEHMSPRQSRSWQSNRPLSSTSINSVKTKTRRSRKQQSTDFSLEELTEQLPQNVKSSLTNMSVKDRKLLEAMMNKANVHHTSYQRQQRTSSGNVPDDKEIRKRDEEYIKKATKREKNHEDVLWRKRAMEKEEREFKEANIDIKTQNWQAQYQRQATKKQRQLHEKQMKEQEKKRRQEENLKRIAEQNQEWINDLTYQDQLRKLERDKKRFGSQKELRECNFDQRKHEHQKLAEHADLMNDLEEKHARAALQFQNMMKQKEFKRTVKSAKERARKERQEEHLKHMQQDLQSWQQELKEYQDISLKRAKEVVEKRNNSKSQKAHIKRLQKELDHLALKERLDKEEQLRQEELQSLIQLKDERSKVISTEKEDYTKASREAARASRAVRDIIKEKTIQSSFDKMAANAEKIARIEQLGKNRPPNPSSLAIKHNSSIMLG